MSSTAVVRVSIPTPATDSQKKETIKEGHSLSAQFATVVSVRVKSEKGRRKKMKELTIWGKYTALSSRYFPQKFQIPKDLKKGGDVRDVHSIPLRIESNEEIDN